MEIAHKAKVGETMGVFGTWSKPPPLAALFSPQLWWPIRPPQLRRGVAPHTKHALCTTALASIAAPVDLAATVTPLSVHPYVSLDAATALSFPLVLAQRQLALCPREMCVVAFLVENKLIVDGE